MPDSPNVPLNWIIPATRDVAKCRWIARLPSCVRTSPEAATETTSTTIANQRVAPVARNRVGEAARGLTREDGEVWSDTSVQIPRVASRHRLRATCATRQNRNRIAIHCLSIDISAGWVKTPQESSWDTSQPTQLLAASAMRASSQNHELISEAIRSAPGPDCRLSRTPCRPGRRQSPGLRGSRLRPGTPR